MYELLNILTEFTFLKFAFLAGLLSGVATGITGSFVVVKRISYIGGGISHAVMGGLGIAYFAGINPMYGALAFALFSAVIISIVKMNLRQNEDTVISALWSIGMATGLIFAFITPGYNVNLLSFLFGNILMVTTENLVLLLILDIIILVVVLLFYRQLVFICFDEEYARIRGLKVDLLYFILISLIALTVVVLVQTVGVILVIALLTLPSAIAAIFTKRIKKMILSSILLNYLFIFTGILTAFLTDLPAGATIILITGAGYLLAFIIKHFLLKI
ncbi:MAG: metal ABC transporter permease [Ignavibacteria bacterium]|nr:metal ABC transporter permease [Ignavibacteria bacterium]